MKQKDKNKDYLTKFYEPMIKLVQHYTCPPSCRALCCRITPITFTEFEGRRIKRMYPGTRKILEDQTSVQIGTIKSRPYVQFTFKNMPCPLLDNNDTCRCTIQEAKPVICGLYPITTGKTEGYENVTVDVCPLGVEIIKDYLLFKAVLTMDYMVASEEKKKEVIKEDVRLTKQLLERAAMFGKEKSCGLLVLPRVHIDPFSSFLDDYTAEQRRRERIGLELLDD